MVLSLMGGMVESRGLLFGLQAGMGCGLGGNGFKIHTNLEKLED